MLTQKKKTPRGAQQLNNAPKRAPRQGLKKTIRGQLILVISTLVLLVALIFPMSVAWFTNVTRTGDLQIETKAWGFDQDKITVSDSVAAMLPGETGFVELFVDNSGGVSAISAAVQVDKSKLSPEMQQRVFFYVDAPRTATFGEGDDAATESVTRQYLAGSGYDYVYSVPRGECLTLSELYYNDAPLKWEWVNDMVGYYFIGTVQPESSVNAEETVTTETAAELVRIDAYLRPIKYDVDEAVFDASGQLTQVGNVPLAEFLKNVFDTDGFESAPLTESGEIDESVIQTVDGKPYYPVAVDENGYGVWAYLCDREELSEAETFDQRVATEGVLSQSVTITVTVTNVEGEEIPVSTAAELREQLRTVEAGRTLKLSEDLTAGEPFSLESNADVTIDLNGYAILFPSGEGEAESAAFTVPAGAKLTLLDGALHGPGGSVNAGETKQTAILCTGGTATVSGVKVTGFDTAVYVDDRAAGGDSLVKLNGCEFDTAATAVLLYGNGDATAARSRVIVQNCTIRSAYIGISGQGTNTEGDRRWGTELVVLNSSISGIWAGIYQPQQQSSAVINGCTITGYTGLVVKGGTVTMYASTVSGTGAYHDAEVAADGFIDTGGGVYVEATYPWSATVILRGEGNTVSSVEGYALELFGANGKGPGKLTAEGGTFSGRMGASHWNDIGTFSVPASTGPTDSTE